MKVSEIVNFHPNMLEARAPIDDLPRNGVGASRKDMSGWVGDSF